MLQSLSSDGDVSMMTVRDVRVMSDVSMMSSVLIITIYGHIWGLLESLTSDTLIAHILRGYICVIFLTVPIYGYCHTITSI